MSAIDAVDGSSTRHESAMVELRVSFHDLPVEGLFVAVHESESGPEPKCALAVGKSAFGSRPD